VENSLVKIQFIKKSGLFRSIINRTSFKPCKRV